MKNILSLACIESILNKLNIDDILYTITESKSTNSIYIAFEYKGEKSILRLSDHCTRKQYKTVYISKSTKEVKVERSILNTINNLKTKHLMDIRV